MLLKSKTTRGDGKYQSGFGHALWITKLLVLVAAENVVPILQLEGANPLLHIDKCH